MTPLRVLGVILAGGRGERLGGRVKALEMLGNTRLIDHVIARARPQADGLLVSANDPLPGLPDDVAVLADAHGALPLDASARNGPLSGIMAALFHAGAHGFERILTFAGDTPFVPRNLGVQLRGGGTGIVLAQVAGQIMPVFGLWPTETAPSLSILVKAGERSVSGAARALGATFVDVACGIGDSFHDLDTPEDMRCLTALLPKT